MSSSYQEPEPVPDLGFPYDPNSDTADAAQLASDIARRLVWGERSADYGHPADTYHRLAGLWSAYLGVEIEPEDAAMMMLLVKVGRQRHKKKYDNLVDIHGYANVIERIQRRKGGQE